MRIQHLTIKPFFLEKILFETIKGNLRSSSKGMIRKSVIFIKLDLLKVIMKNEKKI